MATKTILSKEQLSLLLSTYKQVGTYAAAGRAVGISSAIAKRIITENEAFDTDTSEYTGPQPTQWPRKEDLQTTFIKSAEWWVDYAK